MRRFLAGQLRHRPSRVLALGVAILVAGVSFVLLAAAAKTSGLKVTGTVESNFRPAYDVLVRPKGSKTELERARGLVRDNYLSGIFGGISLKQWHEIKALSGVEIAAPVANIGYILPEASMPVSVQRFVNRDPYQIYRLVFDWVSDNGTSVYPAGRQYVYFNRAHRFTSFGQAGNPGIPEEVVPGRGAVKVCLGLYDTAPVGKGPFRPTTDQQIKCFSSKTPRINRNNFDLPRLAPKGAGVIAGARYPVLLAAIDPVQERRLLHLDRAVVSGRPLRAADRVEIRRARGGYGWRYVPVIVSSRTYVHETLRVTVERLRIPQTAQVPLLLTAGLCLSEYRPCPEGLRQAPPRGWRRGTTAYSFLNSAPAARVGQLTFPSSAAYRGIGIFADPTGRNVETLGAFNYWTVSGTRYAAPAPDVLRPLATSNPPDIWTDPAYVANGGFSPAPPENQDVQFRRLIAHARGNAFIAGSIFQEAHLRIVGRYDPAKLPGFSPLSKVPLETYYPPLLEPKGPGSTRALHGRPLGPSANVGDYVQQPPLVLTTIRALGPYTDKRNFFGSPPLDPRAPLSVIRVRVAGVTGPDAGSQARIRSVALRIHDRTGLDVDITAGSSPHPLTVQLARGKFGRPPLTLTEGWVKKGVSVSFLQAVGRKQLALFTLIPLICCLFLGNGTYAAARVRRAEIGILLTLGWSPPMIFAALLGEVLVIGCVAGLLGVGIAAALVAALSLHAPLLATLLVFPVALGIALVAGLLPAWHAARAEPLTALRPPVNDVKDAHPVRDLTWLALVNLRRVPSRALVGGSGLALGACALTVLLAVQHAFHGVLAGTLLGDAISIQIRGFDYLAVGLVVALAALSIADVLYLNLRERQAELVTLRTFGWGDVHLARVIGLEGLALALASTALGAGLGVAICATLLAVPLSSLVLGALAAAGGGIFATLLASAFPLSQIDRLTPPMVLAADE